MIVLGFDFSGLSTPTLESLWTTQKHLLTQIPEPSPQRPSVAGRLLLAHIQENYLDHIQISTNQEYGFLQLTGGSGQYRYLSLTHSDTIALAALSENPLGIDTEPCSRHLGRVASKLFSERESLTTFQSLLKSVIGYEKVEIAIWCAKESALKATGRGLAFGMQSITLEPAPEFPWTLQCQTLRGPQDISEPRILLTEEREHMIAICSEKTSLNSKPGLKWCKIPG